MVELKDLLAESSRASKFVQQVVTHNPGSSNLLRGLINTFTTLINSASGKLRWSDDVLEAIEVNQNGQETGKRVRLTPAGIGISTDGGQTYQTVMTADGIFTLGNFIVASADGYVKLMADGLKAYDALNNLKVHVGQQGLTAIGGTIKTDSGTSRIEITPTELAMYQNDQKSMGMEPSSVGAIRLYYNGQYVGYIGTIYIGIAGYYSGNAIAIMPYVAIGNGRALYVDTEGQPIIVEGDLYVKKPGKGLVIQDGNFNRWRIRVDTSGNLYTELA